MLYLFPQEEIIEEEEFIEEEEEIIKEEEEIEEMTIIKKSIEIEDLTGSPIGTYEHDITSKQQSAYLDDGTIFSVFQDGSNNYIYSTDSDFTNWTLLKTYALSTYYGISLYSDGTNIYYSYLTHASGTNIYTYKSIDNGATWSLDKSGAYTYSATQSDLRISYFKIESGKTNLIVITADTIAFVLTYTLHIYEENSGTGNWDLNTSVNLSPLNSSYVIGDEFALIMEDDGSGNTDSVFYQLNGNDIYTNQYTFTSITIDNYRFSGAFSVYKYTLSDGTYAYKLITTVYNTVTTSYYVFLFLIQTPDTIDNVNTEITYNILQEGKIEAFRFDNTNLVIDEKLKKAGYLNQSGMFIPLIDIDTILGSVNRYWFGENVILLAADGNPYILTLSDETLALTQCSTHYSVNKSPTLAVMGTYVPTKNVAWILYDDTTLIYMGMLVNWKHDGTQYTYEIISYEELDRQVEITESFTTDKPSEIFEYSVLKYGRFLYPGTIDVGTRDYSPSFKRKSLEHLFDWCDNAQADLIYIEPDGKANFTDSLVVRAAIIEADGGFMQFQYSSEPKSLQNLELKGKFDATLGKPVEVVRENQLGGSWYRDWLPEMDETDLIAYADELEAKKNTDLVSIQITRPVSVITTFYQIGDRAAVTSTRYGMAADVCYVIETDNDYISRLSGAVLNNALYVEMNKDMKEKEGMKNDVKKLGYEVEEIQVTAASVEDRVATLETDYLPKSGGTMSGAIAMGSNKVTGLAAGTANGDALRYEQLIVGWTTVSSFSNSWVNYGSPAGAAKYRKIGDTVYLTGMIKNGTVGLYAFQLPSGYRPSSNKYFSTVSNSAFGRISVDTNGYVWMDVGNNAWFSLDGIYFPI